MGRIVVNGSFLSQQTTAARDARTLLMALAPRFGGQIALATPDAGILEEPAALGVTRPALWQPAEALTWEQTDLPGLLHGDDILVSLHGTGPPRRRQVLRIPDADLADPTLADPDLRDFVESTQPGTARRAAVVVATSESRAQDIRALMGVRVVHVVTSGVDEAFLSTHPDRDTAHGFRPYALGIGAHEHASRLDWLALRWKLLSHDTSLNLVLTASSNGHEPRPRLPAGVHVVLDPTDRHLAQLYANAEMLVFPGAEAALDDPTGPLIRALASGTPFLATDTAAARAAAVAPDAQLIQRGDPRRPGDLTEDEAWVARMHQWSTGGSPVSRAECRSKAARFSWSAAADRLASLIRSVR